MYDIIYSAKAEEDLVKLRHSEPAAYKKAVKLLNELMLHPRTGTGHPEQLKGDRTGQWSHDENKYDDYFKQMTIIVRSSLGSAPSRCFSTSAVSDSIS